MKKHVRIILIVFIALSSTAMMYAQEWTKEQSEAWKLVEDNWKNWKSGDPAKVASLLHEKYQGWSNEMPLPMGKSKLVSWYTEMKDNMKVETYEIEPARIAVTKNAAVIDYYFYMNMSYTKDGKKESKEMSGKTVEFYVKDGDKWQLLGDMTVNKDDKEGMDD